MAGWGCGGVCEAAREEGGEGLAVGGGGKSDAWTCLGGERVVERRLGRLLSTCRIVGHMLLASYPEP